MGKLSEEQAAKDAVWVVPSLPVFLAEADKAPLWLVKGLLLDSATTLCSGQQKFAWKSYLAMHASVGLAAGVPFGKWEPAEKAPVLYALEEGPRAPTAARLRAVCRSLAVDPDALDTTFFIAHKHGIKLDVKGWEAKVPAKVKELGCKLLVLDSIGYMHAGDENSTQDMQKVRDTVQAVNRLGCAVLLIHHLKKDVNMKMDADLQVRGSGVAVNQYDTHLVLRRASEALPHAYFQIRHKDFAWPPSMNFRMQFENDPDGNVIQADLVLSDPAAARKAKWDECARALKEGVSYSGGRLQAMWDLPAKAARIMCEELAEAGVMTRNGTEWRLASKTAPVPTAESNVRPLKRAKKEKLDVSAEGD